MKDCNGIVVAIDGPAGSGKSTIARLAAKRLGFKYLDTGAMYRAVTLLALRRNVNLEDGRSLAEAARSMEFELNDPDEGLRLLIDGEDISLEIRGPDVDKWVSLVSSHREVREYLVGLQREMGRSGGVVCEGRDIGTVVFPEAPVKFFVTAAPDVRAGRRKRQLGRAAEDMSEDDIEREMDRRDKQDSSRDLSPLSRASDAMLLDTTQLTIEEEVKQVVETVRRLTARTS
jgi:cytidylate kinase